MVITTNSFWRCVYASIRRATIKNLTNQTHVFASALTAANLFQVGSLLLLSHLALYFYTELNFSKKDLTTGLFFWCTSCSYDANAFYICITKKIPNWLRAIAVDLVLGIVLNTSRTENSWKKSQIFSPQFTRSHNPSVGFLRRHHVDKPFHMRKSFLFVSYCILHPQLTQVTHYWQPGNHTITTSSRNTS